MIRVFLFLTFLVFAGCQLTEKSADKCARLAAHPEEGIAINDQKVGNPFPVKSPTEAIAVCREALKADVDPRINFWIARALLSQKTVTKEVLKEATYFATKAVDAGYGKANLALGFINYHYKPQNAQTAYRHYEMAFAAGMPSARSGMAHAYAFGLNTKAFRREGIALLEIMAKDYPGELLNIAAAYEALGTRREDLNKAADALKKASSQNITGAELALAKLYYEPGRAFRNLKAAREHAQKAIKNGQRKGYEIWFDSYYRANKSKPDFANAIRVAKKGAAANDTHSNYLLGFMTYHAQGTKKNSIEAEKHLKKASSKGHKQATELLRKVSRRANQIRNQPKYSGQSCVTSKRSRYDRDNIEYFNKCNHSINTVVCSRHVAGDFFSLFDGKNREKCRRKTVGANKYIDFFYGSNRNSSFLRKAIANSSIKVGACHPPLTATLRGSKVYCDET